MITSDPDGAGNPAPPRVAALAFGGFAIVALIVTWPLGRGLGRDVAWDLGDPLLVMWALAWDSRQIAALLTGHVEAATQFFNGNIFHPTPLALAHSEHLVGEALLILPVQWITGNVILSYNLLFLASFALSALGMFLFVRDLTGRTGAAVVAGVVFGFAPYRLPQGSHLHVLSSQWMPFVLLGVRRYAQGGRLRSMVGAALALALQGLSSGYHLLYFTPFAAAYAIWEGFAAGRLRTMRYWAHAAIGAAIVALLVGPFLLPYLALQSTGVTRHRDEITRFSADVYSYLTAFPGQPIWGRTLRAFPKAEGDLFPGLTSLTLAVSGLLWWRVGGGPGAMPTAAVEPRWRIWTARAIGTAAALHLAAAVAVMFERRIVIDIGPLVVRMSDIDQLLLRAAAGAALAVAVSASVRSTAAAFVRARGFALVAALTAVWLSLGPQPQALGRPLELSGAYALLLEYVPGYGGVRVPARFVVSATLWLAVLAGYGALAIERRWGPRPLVLAAALVVAEGAVHPFVVNGAEAPEGYLAAEARVMPPAEAPAVYRRLAGEAKDAVVVELPLGIPDFDLRAVYYAATHWRRVANGYSGFFPPHYGRLALALSDLTHHPDIGWGALQEVGATHVVVHEHVFRTDGASVTNALVQRGAHILLRDGGDVLLRVR